MTGHLSRKTIQKRQRQRCQLLQTKFKRSIFKINEREEQVSYLLTRSFRSAFKW